jgi:NAD(P)-dependent dehydrogenase (short-subunit alcohol dehydrogenase family)
MSRIILITGALSGIGRASALAFAAEGSTVVITGRNAVAGEVLKSELLQVGAPNADFVRVDVTQEADIIAALNFIEQKYGRLDVAVNNAGIEGEFSAIEATTVETYSAVFGTNVLGLMLSMKHEVALMKKASSGSIINLSSIGGIVGFPGSSIYAASKHAVEGLTKSAALELAPSGIRVNSVAPGPTATPMLDRLAAFGLTKQALSDLIPAQRPGTSAEVAQAILFLGSDNARFIMGHSIAVDGGYLAK